MNRQKLVLFILVIILLLALVYAFWSMPEQQTVDSVNNTRASEPKSRSGVDAPAAVDPQRVHLELLEGDKADYTGYRRNIFNYYQPKPEPIEIKDKEPVNRNGVTVYNQNCANCHKVEGFDASGTVDLAGQGSLSVTKLATGHGGSMTQVEKNNLIIWLDTWSPKREKEIRIALARFTFLGFLVKESERTVFLASQKEKELFVVKKNDKFGDNNQFEVVDVTEEKMTISQTGARGLIEIRLVEDEPLIPSFSPGELKGGGAIFVPPEEVPIAEPQPQTGVPGAERNRQWFKDTQPGQSAQPGSVEGQ